MNNIIEETVDMPIENWSLFGVSKAALQIFRFPDDERDNEYIYQSAVVMLLDRANEKLEQGITIFTKIIDDNCLQCVRQTAISMNDLFDFISDHVSVIDENMNVLQEYSLNKLFTDDKFELPSLGNNSIQENKKLH